MIQARLLRILHGEYSRFCQCSSSRGADRREGSGIVHATKGTPASERAHNALERHNATTNRAGKEKSSVGRTGLEPVTDGFGQSDLPISI